MHGSRDRHYDLRLEHNGVLKSWALRDGPCLDPTKCRLAVLVDDHRVEYGSSERVIPPGQYGAGAVLLWDYGIWWSSQDVDQALRDGRLEFHLEGRKLAGLWSLSRVPVGSGVRGKDWLLRKEPDAEARPLSEMNIVREMPRSVLTGRTLDEVAAEPHRFESVKRERNVPDRNQLSLPFDDVEPWLVAPSRMANST